MPEKTPHPRGGGERPVPRGWPRRRVMRTKRQSVPRRGSILPMLMISVVALCGFVALAIDVGMLVVGRNMAQAAADAAAMTGARNLNGGTDSNTGAATSAAKAVAMANEILGVQITEPQVTIEHGAYAYNESTKTYYEQYPPAGSNRYNLTRATVTYTGASAFARVININSLNISATSTAAHRPRDVGVILDFSGSMNNESDLWNNEGYLGTAN